MLNQGVLTIYRNHSYESLVHIHKILKYDKVGERTALN